MHWLYLSFLAISATRSNHHHGCGPLKAPSMWRAHLSTSILCPFVTLHFCMCLYIWKTPLHPSKHNSTIITHWSFSHFPRQSYPIAPSSVSIPIPSYIARHLWSISCHLLEGRNHFSSLPPASAPGAQRPQLRSAGLRTPGEAVYLSKPRFPCLPQG